MAQFQLSKAAETRAAEYGISPESLQYAMERDPMIRRTWLKYDGLDKGVLPTFFRACCMEAEQARHGGYKNAGWHLGRHTERLVDESAPIDMLRAACRNMDIESVLRWYAQWLPRCLELVPTRRRKQLARGVIEEHLNDVGA